MFREAEYPIYIPTYENGHWVEDTEFVSQRDFIDFILNLFKEPGQYDFDESVVHWQDQSNHYREFGYYTKAPFRSKDYIKYWDDQKNKSRIGTIYKNGDKTWYLSRDYYFWLNFLPIFDKEKGIYDFPQIWDVQYHIALFELLAELHNKHVSMLKKRQIASSYFHCGKLINFYWFEEGAKLKIGASLKDYINDKGSWKMLREYSDFLNEHTAWYRPSNPGKVGDWEQKIQMTINGRDIFKGLKSTLTSHTFEKDPTAGVGGPCRIFFHEEGGIAPKADQTYEFMRPALHSGMVTTGLFIIAGSVGDLDQCEPLKEYILHPDENDFYAVESNLMDEEGTWGRHGLFIPEQWSMPPYIDSFGNSMVEEALNAIMEQRKQWKKDLEPAKYQLRISQKPTNIKEAFAYRTASKFPLHILTNQTRKIEDKHYNSEYLNLKRGANGDIIVSNSRKQPIMEFPVRKADTDKEGVIQVWERPIKNPEFGTYYASIDPVGEGKAEWINNFVYVPTGQRKIGDLLVGDKVIGSDGKPTEVIGIYPQGEKELYEVSFNDGTSILVCKEHLWSVQLNGGTKSHILSVKDMLDKTKTITYNGEGKNSTKQYTTSTYYKNSKGLSKWYIPLTQPINFQDYPEPSISPYLLGALLGDGGFSQRGIIFSSADKEIINRVSQELTQDLKVSKIPGDNYDYRILTVKGNRNSLSKKLKDYSLKGLTSEKKFIPAHYKFSSIKNRLNILRGLMDTDGSATNNGAEFYSSSKTLANDVCDIVRSLGGIAKIRCKKTTHKDSYIVRVILPEGMNPFYLKRKADKYKIKRRNNRYITDIKYCCKEEAVCIKVDAEDSLYVTENATVTHNTTTSESLCSIFIYKNSLEVTRRNINGDIETFIEPGKIVASWCGRFDDINQTHERLELMIEWYNAWTVVENNVSLFIQHMIAQRKQKYLVPKDQMIFLKNIGANKNVFQEYGWKNTGTLFKDHLLNYAIEFVKEQLDVEHDENGDITNIVYGAERIPDIMLLKEMSEYQEGLNVDRLVAFTALVAFIKVQDSNRGFKRVVREEEGNNLQNSPDLFKLNRKPFSNLGHNSSNKLGALKPKRGFRNIR